MIIADGENLVLRYQAMLKDGCPAADAVRHRPDAYVWHQHITSFRAWDLIRASY